MEKTCIDEEGNVCFPNGRVKDRESLYHEAVNALVGKGPNLKERRVPGPAFRFRK